MEKKIYNWPPGAESVQGDMAVVVRQILPGEPNTHQIVGGYLERIDPLSGPNVMRYVAANFTDNGDGTMTIRRLLPFVRSGE